MKKIVSYLLLLTITFQLFCAFEVSANISEEDSSLNASINVQTRNVVVSGKTNASSNVMVNVFYPNMQETQINPLNIKSVLAYTTMSHSDENGDYSAEFILPETAPYGTYFIKTSCNEGVEQTSFNLFDAKRTVLSEEFSNSYLWKVNDMGISNGTLISKSSSVCSASLKGNNNFGICEEYSFDFSFTDDNDGWLQFIFRNNVVSAERLLIYKGRLSRYLPGESVSEVHLARYSLSKDTIYNINIAANGNVVKIVLSDKETSEIVASGEYESGNVVGGNVGFETYKRNVTIDNFNVVCKDSSNLYFSEKPMFVYAGDTLDLAVVNHGGNNITFESSDSSVATVADGIVTGIKPGTVSVSVTDGEKSDICSITVIQKPREFTVSNNDLTLEAGENISVAFSAVPNGADCSDVMWTTGDEEVASVFGSAYTTRTICAKKPGVTLIKAKSDSSGAEASYTVRVMPKESEGTIYASFDANNTATPIKENVFGITNETVSTDQNTYNLFEEIGFNIIRTFGVGQGKSYSADNFDFANKLNVPQMLALPFYNQTVDEMVAQVGEISQYLNENDTLFIEFGNELYDGTMNSADFVQKCQSAYTNIKSTYPNAKIGVPYYARYSTGPWNEALLACADYYDAIILHCYNDFTNGINRLTQDDTMQYMYSYNNFHEQMIKKYKNLLPDKEIWISEYGTLINSLFAQSDSSEKARMQFAKSTGVALTNMEKVMNMLSDENVDMAAYHFPNDAQGFGIIQGNIQLPNYYTFKMISDILDTCQYTYDISSIQCEKYPSIGSVISDPGTRMDCAVDKVGAWGFGDENDIRYVVFSNRSPKSANVMLNGKKVKRIWSYGGTDDVLGEFLTQTSSFTSAPTTIEEPQVYSDEEFADDVYMDGYSVIVCEIEDSAQNYSISCNVETDGEKWNFNENGGLKVTIGSGYTLASDDVSLIENGKPVEVSISVDSQGMYVVEPVNGFSYDSSYELSVRGKIFSFDTVSKPFYEEYSIDFYDNFSSLLNSNWEKSSNSGWSTYGELSKLNTNYTHCDIKNKTFDNFDMTFDLKMSSNMLSDTSQKLRIYFNGGFCDINSAGSILTYFNGKNDVFAGKAMIPADGKVTFRIVSVDGLVKIYSRKTGDKYYTFASEFATASNSAQPVGFGGNSIYSIDNVEIKSNQTMFEDVRYFQMISGEEISLKQLTGGRNVIDVVLSESVDAEHTLFAALYDKGRLVTMLSPTQSTQNEYSFEVQMNGNENYHLKLFLWNNFEQIMPLETTYIIK